MPSSIKTGSLLPGAFGGYKSLLSFRIVYFDYNATTPLDPNVQAAMLPLMSEVWGNPSSVHKVGRKARALLDGLRERACRVLGCKPSELIFTSGGTESANLAVMGTARMLKSKGKGAHIICSSIEHHAVLHAFDYLKTREGFEVTQLPVDDNGLLNPDDLRRAIRPNTVLVSIMAANNEVGTVQPIAALGEICRGQGVVFHTDAVQWFGKMPFESIHQFNADLVSICAHKMHGPKGSGALFIRSPLHPDPILLGGGHENERRAGTENVAGIAGLVECLEHYLKRPVFDPEKMSHLTGRLVELLLKVPGVYILGDKNARLPNTVAVAVEGADSIALIAGLDLEGVCASSGSACTAGSLEPSHVVRAMGKSDALANSLVRFSLGRESTMEEVEHVGKVFPRIVNRVQRFQKRSDNL